jgi:hypothetical protein
MIYNFISLVNRFKIYMQVCRLYTENFYIVNLQIIYDHVMISKITI